MKYTVIAAALMCGLSSPAWAAKDMACSIHADKKTDKVALASLARVPQDTAQQMALSSIALPDDRKQVADNGLKVERGCLVYFFDIQRVGAKDTQEILVD